MRIEGDVQGCGFRDFAVSQATGFGLKGWVRNRSDGTVEAVAFGPRMEVEAFITTCIKGPPGARVTAINVEAAETPKEMIFTRRATV
ncbi:MAG: acylphosphatase [Alphaproteobacteria bacterium]|nr:acylphosphatase [Alphaproteobacteria bacterium]